MRINLVTPFAEKDAVKALGARWDSANRIWYVIDVTDLTPFMRWMPNLDAVSKKPEFAAMPRPKDAARVPVDRFAGPTTMSTVDVAHCGCDVLPWEDCKHTAKA